MGTAIAYRPHTCNILVGFKLKPLKAFYKGNSVGSYLHSIHGQRVVSLFLILFIQAVLSLPHITAMFSSMDMMFSNTICAIKKLCSQSNTTAMMSLCRASKFKYQ